MLDIQAPEVIERWFDYPNSTDESYLLRYTPPSKVKEQSDVSIIHECLCDWKGVFAGGEAITCSAENREVFLESPAGMVRLMWMVRMACDITQFIETEAILKNLSRPHAGGARGLAQA